MTSATRSRRSLCAAKLARDRDRQRRLPCIHIVDGIVPTFGNQPDLVADADTDGQLGPGGRDGALRLIVPRDHGGGRYLSNLVSLQVIDAGRIAFLSLNISLTITRSLRLAFLSAGPLVGTRLHARWRCGSRFLFATSMRRSISYGAHQVKCRIDQSNM
jgi:hypothetical protein